MPRRDEVVELSKSLRAIAGKPADGPKADAANAQRRVLFRKVLQLLTVNVDASSLFPDVVMNAHTSDVACKKMLYHYITHYARQKSDLALLTVNTLQKDCADVNPTIRGLAIRSMASLRVENLSEYLVGAVQKGLVDKHPYPRRVAAMGVLKIYDLNPTAVRETSLLDDLRKMLIAEMDAGVVGNCLIVLKEIDGVQTLATKPIVYALINRIKSFSEWNQVLILDLVSAYELETSEETFDIMNALESRLGAPNSAIVLGTVKIFLNITLGMPDVHQQVLERIKAPLFTLANSGLAETAYAVWAHIRLLVKRAPMLFSTDYKSFYFRASDSNAVKRLKLSMLTEIADAQNTYAIVTELTEYVTDVDAAIACASVRAVGDIALVSADDIDGIVDRLLLFFDLDIDHVTAETIVVAADILRKRPKHTGKCIKAMENIDLYDISEPKARIALIWIYGEYGEDIPSAPYYVEQSLLNLSDEVTPRVRVQLLACAMNLFFKRPPEMQAMLGAALEAGARDVDQEVRETAMVYYRLLERDVEAAARVVNSRDKSPIYTFKESTVDEKTFDMVFTEMNTLSVLYERPSETFINADAATRRTYDDDEPAAETEDLVGSSLLDHADMIDFGADDASDNASTSGGSAVNLMSLLDIDVPATAAMATPTAFALTPSPALDPASFQSKWASSTIVASGVQIALESTSALAQSGPSALSHHMTAHHIATMASGGQPDAMKFYFYAIDRDGAHDTYLVEIVVNVSAKSALFTAKCSGRGSNFTQFQNYFQDAVRQLQ